MAAKPVALLGLVLTLGAVAIGGAQTPAQTPAPAPVIPTTHTTALDGRSLTLPNDLQTRATVLILGFGRHSQNATTAWEKAVLGQLAPGNRIGFYDMAMLAEVPAFIRPLILRRVRNAVPDVLKPNFLPLTEAEDDWKRVAGYTATEPEAAYVMLVDRSGHVRWSTHAAFSAPGFEALRHAADTLSRSPN